LLSSANGGQPDELDELSALDWLSSDEDEFSAPDWLASDELADDDSKKCEVKPTRAPDALSTASFTRRQVTSSGAMQSPLS
jgi:hypothetical protein